MSLGLAINNALSGLAVSQKALAVVSQNIANANTEGYSKQTVNQAAVYAGSQGMGVQVESVTRKVDQYLTRTLIAKGAEVGATSTITAYNDRIQNLLGSPGDDNTLDEYVSNFFSGVQALAESPDRTSYRANAVDSAVVLSQKIAGLAEGLEDLRYQADHDIGESVRTINTQLTSIDNLNQAIIQTHSLGGSTAGLEDQRDMAIKKIASYMDVQTLTQPNGATFLYTKSGASLVDDNLFQLRYTQANSVTTFEADANLNSLDVVRINEDGTDSKDSRTLISAGSLSGITSAIGSGSLSSLQQLRDKDIPDILAQLDSLASSLRDAFNAIHNDGSSYPGADELTGTRAVSAKETSQWAGKVTIAVLDPAGNPVLSPYGDESYTGIRPLTLDLASLDSGFGEGKPTNQTIIDEINNYFSPPPVKAELGNLNNIQLVSNTSALPDLPPMFNFDFDLGNISNFPADFFVNGVTVTDENGLDITNVTSTIPTITFSATNTFSTLSAGSGLVQVAANTTGLKEGDVISITDPGTAGVDGITGAQLTGTFKITGVTPTGFTIATTGSALTGGVGANTLAAAGTPAYDQADAGTQGRTKSNGTFTANLSGSPASAYYDITVNVAATEGKITNGVTSSGTITYRIYNQQSNLLNDRYNATAASGAVSRVPGNTSQPSVIATMVDANGNELPKQNGVYSDQPGFLKIAAFDSKNTIAIDEGDSKQVGLPNQAGTGRGFSYYFELNNFFASNEPTKTGDTVKGSAINFKVEDRIQDNASLISLGSITASTQPIDPSAHKVYTVLRSNADNDIAQKLAGLGNGSQTFQAAGGLDAITTSFSGYTGEILGYVSSKAVQADSQASNAKTLYDGFATQLDSIAGVNIDEELANTIIYQHAYTASARIITVADQLFDTLLGLGQ